MEEAADADPTIASRVEHFLHRVPEELYDFENDPDGLHNLIDDSAHAAAADDLRSALEEWMKKMEDPALEAFQNRQSRPALDHLMDKTTLIIGGEGRQLVPDSDELEEEYCARQSLPIMATLELSCP